MKVLYVILVSYASAGLAQAALLYAYRSKSAQEFMISDDAHRSKVSHDWSDNERALRQFGYNDQN